MAKKKAPKTINPEKEVKISCVGADYASLDDFEDFQGDLKTLPEENYEKLKNQILDLGFCEPIAAWVDGNVKRIIDGHQRIATLKRMRDDGYHVPYLPYFIVEAASENDAKMKLLSMLSEYGVLNEDGFIRFTESLKLSPIDLSQRLNLPTLDLAAVHMKVVEPAPVESSETVREADEENERVAPTSSASTVKGISFYFSAEQYPDVVDRLNAFMEHFKADDYSETLLRLMDAVDIVKKTRR